MAVGEGVEDAISERMDTWVIKVNGRVGNRLHYTVGV